MSDGTRAHVYGPQEIARLVDGACAGSTSFSEIGSSLYETARTLFGDDERSSPLAPFVNAFSYDLAESTTERRKEYGPFVPIFEGAESSFPPRLEAIEADQIGAWIEVQCVVTEPAARARLCDLLWTIRADEQPHLFARVALVAYREVAADWEDLAAGEALARSLELALQLGDEEQADASASAIITAAEAALAESDQKPGVSLRLIEALLEMPRPPAAVDDLLDRAAVRYRANVFVGDAIADMRAARANADPARVEAIRREQLRHWFDHALNCEPLVALHHLQHALALARDFGFRDEQTRFRLELQRLDRDEMNFQRIEASAPIDKEVLEELIESIVQPTWSESLLAFGATGPLTGDALANERTVRQVMQDHPIAFLFPHTTLGSENSIIRNSASEEERFEEALAQHEVRAILFWGHVIIEAMRRIEERTGRPTEDELADHFRMGVTVEVADAFARALLAYLDGRYDESSLLLAVRIEAAIRKLAREAGLVVIREPVGIRPGGVRTLGILLQALRPTFADRSWWRYLWNALAEPLGLNLRNQLAHGLAEGSQLTAAILLHIACCLALLGPVEPGATSE